MPPNLDDYSKYYTNIFPTNEVYEISSIGINVGEDLELPIHELPSHEAMPLNINTK